MQAIKKISFKCFTVLFLLLFLAGFAAACGDGKSSKYGIVDAEYYQMKVAQFEEENKTYKEGDVDVVFVGDSWTDGYRPLEEYYPEFKVLNRGIGGDNSYGLLKRLDVSIYQVKPKIVVMLIGGNNMDDCEKDIKKIVLDIKEKLPETRIVMQSMYSASNKDFLKKEKKKMIHLCKYFKSLANKYDLTYVDLYSHLVDKKGNGIEEYHVEDGVHMSDLGYQVITEHLKPVLLDLLSK